MKWNKVKCDQYWRIVESSHILPQEKREVLVRITNGGGWGVLVGYIKYAGGDRSCPGFIVPNGRDGDLVAWCDCLPTEFVWPNDKHMEILKDE